MHRGDNAATQEGHHWKVKAEIGVTLPQTTVSEIAGRLPEARNRFPLMVLKGPSLTGASIPDF